MRRELTGGMLAGAAGTTALNATTYLDMALRGRGASNTPEQAVEASAHRVGMAIPGDAQTQENRRQGLGPLFGASVGTGVGAAAGIVRAISAISMMVLGISDPREWTLDDWVSDLVPHLAYGAATFAVLRMTRD